MLDETPTCIQCVPDLHYSTTFGCNSIVPSTWYTSGSSVAHLVNCKDTPLCTLAYTRKRRRG